MKRSFLSLLIILVLSLGMIMTGCGRMIGAPADTTPPTVTFTVPANSAVSVARGNKLTATFSELMDPTTISTSTFTLMKTSGSTAVAGTVTYTGVTAVFVPASSLASNTNYTATITTGTRDLAGNAMVTNTVWSFTTGSGTDTTPPTVSSTIPVNLATGVATNTKVSAIFSEALDPTTVGTTEFTLKQGTTAIAGTVNYAGVTAVFIPAANLAANTTYTATITTGVQDLAGNALAANKTWSFTTGAGADTTAPTVNSTIPADLATNVAVNSSVTATFSEAMDPLTMTNVIFSLKQGTTTVEGVVTYAGNVATFTPAANLAAGTTYVATINTGAKDLAGNALAADKVWSFKTAGGLAPGAVPLGVASTYGLAASGAITSTLPTGSSTINGNVALTPGTSITGSPIVNGVTNINNATAVSVMTALLDAYNFAWAQATTVTLTPGADQGAIYSSGMPPGVYESASTMLINTNLILDGGGNPDAVWIFKIGSSLTTTSGNVLLTKEAQAKNVFFVPTAAATVGTNTTFNGNILAGGNVTANTGATINGRILSGALAGSSSTLALQSSTVNVPQP